MTAVKYPRIPLNHLNLPGVGGGGMNFANFTLNQTTDKQVFITDARDTNAITHIGVRVSGHAGTPPTYKIGLQGVSLATGLADGTYLGGGSPASMTFTPPADSSWDSTFQWLALDNSYTPASAGELLAIVCEYSSGTVDGSNNSSFSERLTDVVSTLWNFPYAVVVDGGSSSKRDDIAVFGLRTASSRYGNPIKSTYGTVSASTVGIRNAIKFNLPTAMGSTLKIRGFKWAGQFAQATGKAPIMGIWNAAGTALQTRTLDSDLGNNASATQRIHEYLFTGSLATLDFGTDYYIGLEVADAASGGVAINGLQLDSADDGDAFPFGASNCILSSYSGGTWTDDATIRPFAELIVEEWAVPAGGGAGVVPRFGKHGDGPSFRGAA